MQRCIKLSDESITNILTDTEIDVFDNGTIESLLHIKKRITPVRGPFAALSSSYLARVFQ